ncbi:MAG: glycosyltransferase family 39 protein [Gemmataceae bacterium]|nr:glycosyltransferase family 39 protein [Gemmataceae bacterium]
MDPSTPSIPWDRRAFGVPLATWLVVFLTVGVMLRGGHYLRNDPVWHDEAALIVNVLEKSYAEIWGPRLFNETGPPLFLWLEKAVIAVIGDSTYALRLVPLLAGIAALFVGVRTLRPIATPIELLLFALMFAISDRLLWHCTEAKMYSTDVLIAALLALLFVRQEKAVPTFAEGLLLAGASGLMFFSFPAVFILPAYGLARFPSLIRSRSVAG